MKGVPLTLSLLLINLSVLGQGTVIFNNRVVGSVVTHVYGPEPGNPERSITGNGPNDYPAGTTTYTGAALEGSNYLAVLLAYSGDVLQPASTAPVTFRTGAAAGFVNPTTATLTGVPADANVATIRMVVWDNSSGNYPVWNGGTMAAWNAGAIVAGMSPSFTLHAIGGVSNPAPNLVGLQSFNLYFVPEPSLGTLFSLSGAMFVAWLRKRKA